MPAFGSQPGLPAFTAANNKIFIDGKPIRLRGANWFGFEGANAVVDGLWERPMAEAARKPGSAQRAAAVVTRKVKETVGKARGRELVPTHDME